MEIKFLKNTYNVIVWDPLLPVINSQWIACDTETEEIIKGSPLVPVITQIFDPIHNIVHIIRHMHISLYLERFFKENPNTRWVFHTASFDLDVLDWRNNKFKELVDNNLITDIYLRIILQELEKGKYKQGRHSLDQMSYFYLGYKMSKDKNIRLTFKQNMVLTEDYIKYAAIDAIATGLLYKKLPHKQPTEDLQFKGSLVLRGISNNGLLVDSKEFDRLQEKYSKLLLEASNTLALFGWRKGVPGNTLIWQKILRNIEERCNVKFPKTPKTKLLQLTEDMLEKMEKNNNLPPVLRAYKDLTHYNKMLSTYLNKENIGMDTRLHSYFTPLVSSGRTSSSKPNVQNFPRSGGLRGYIIAPKNHVLVSCDYNQLELCVLAQSCLSRFGNSIMANLINSGKDLHTYMGQHIAKSEGVTFDTLTKKEKKRYRNLAKVPNFGFPGGLGTGSLISFAKNTYNVVISLEEAKKLKKLWLEIYPEMKLHLKGTVDDIWTTKMFRNTLETLYPYTNRGITTIEELEYKLKEDGLSDSEVFGVTSEIYRYQYKTLSGRVKRNCTYNAGANGHFQPDAADGAKKALWNVYNAGFKMVNFIHDEIIVELPIDKHLHDNVQLLKDLMESSMQKMIPDVKITAEPAASIKWYKEAEPIYDSQGLFTIWHPNISIPKEFEKDIEDGNIKNLENKCVEKDLNILYENPRKTKIYGFEKKGDNPINWY